MSFKKINIQTYLEVIDTINSKGFLKIDKLSNYVLVLNLNTNRNQIFNYTGKFIMYSTLFFVILGHNIWDISDFIISFTIIFIGYIISIFPKWLSDELIVFNRIDKTVVVPKIIGIGTKKYRFNRMFFKQKRINNINYCFLMKKNGLDIGYKICNRCIDNNKNVYTIIDLIKWFMETENIQYKRKIDTI